MFVSFWNVPAGRSGDGALGLAHPAAAPRPITVSRFDRHPTPKDAAPVSAIPGETQASACGDGKACGLKPSPYNAPQPTGRSGRNEPHGPYRRNLGAHQTRRAGARVGRGNPPPIRGGRAADSKRPLGLALTRAA